jgi:Uma2 family endonuclease
VQASPEPAAPPEAPPLRISYEEFLDWLDEDKHAEWVNGEVIMHSPVSRGHNRLGRFLIKVIDTFNEAHDLGELFYEPFQMKIGPDFPGRAPDIMFAAKANLGRVENNVLRGPADLIVEILSPESRGRDRGEKYYEYERGGVREYWMLDPERRTSEFNRLDADGRYQIVPPDADERLHSDVLPGFWVRVDWLYRETLPTLRDVQRAWEDAR